MSQVRLTERDRRVLLHVGRFGITTRAVLKQWFCKTDDAVKTLLSRLAAPLPPDGLPAKQHLARFDGFYLRTSKLGVGRLRYYQLTRLGLQTVGLPLSRNREFATQGLATHYAVLVHCCLRRILRLLFTRAEFHGELQAWRERLYPDLAPENVAALRYERAYYTQEHNDRVQLVRVVHDLGADPSSMAAKCRETVADLQRRSQFITRLIDRRHFTLAVLVGEREKRDAIRDALAEQPIRGVEPIYDVIENLTELVQDYAKPQTILSARPRRRDQLRADRPRDRASTARPRLPYAPDDRRH